MSIDAVTGPRSRATIWIHTPLRLVSGVLAAFAVLASAALLLFDIPHGVLPQLRHAPVSAIPLLFIGIAYVCLQPLTRPSIPELIQRLLLGSAFILWGIDQMLPPGLAATVIGDLVISLYVLDLSVIIREHLRKEDWNTP